MESRRTLLSATSAPSIAYDRSMTIVLGHSVDKVVLFSDTHRMNATNAMIARIYDPTVRNSEASTVIPFQQQASENNQYTTVITDSAESLQGRTANSYYYIDGPDRNSTYRPSGHTTPPRPIKVRPSAQDQYKMPLHTSSTMIYLSPVCRTHTIYANSSVNSVSDEGRESCQCHLLEQTTACLDEAEEGSQGRVTQRSQR